MKPTTDPTAARQCAVIATGIVKDSVHRTRELRARGEPDRAVKWRQAAQRFAAIAAAWSVAATLTGCAGLRSLVTARIEIEHGTNRVSVVQPKDTTIEALSLDPKTGTLRLEGYASAGNAEAIAAAKAQAEAQAKVIGDAFGMVRELAGAFARMQGAPIPAAAPAPTNAAPAPTSASAWTNPVAIPPGFKLVPVDDPSRPVLELDPEGRP